MIQLFHLSKKYENHIALDDINLRIEKGEFVFVTGPSGAGKTTLLRLLFGAEKPEKGYILINAINLTRISRSKMDLCRHSWNWNLPNPNVIVPRNPIATVRITK